MVLLLDPYEEIMKIESKRSKLRDVDKVAALVKLYERLLIIPENFLDLVDEIIIINFISTEHISESIFRKSLRRIIKRGKAYSDIAYLLDSAHIFSFKSGEEFYLFFNSLIREYQKKQFIFFDTLLTPLMPAILVGCENVQGFRLIKAESGEPEWRRIENIKKYIFCGLALSNKLSDMDHFELAVIENSKDYISGLINHFTYLINSGSMNHHMVLFKKDEIKNQNRLLQNLTNEIGNFTVHDCKINGVKLSTKFDHYIIYGIENLNESTRHNFLNDIITKPFSTKKIVFIVERQLDLSEFPTIRFWIEFHEDPSKIFKDYVLPNIKAAVNAFNKKFIEYKRFFKLFYSIESEKKLVDDFLKSLFEMQPDMYERGQVNFFYDLDSQELNDIGSELKPFSTIFREIDTAEKKEVCNIKITHNIEDSMWEIKKEKEPPILLSYEDYIGIKYIAYLWLHYKKKSISDTELRRVVYKWHGSKKKKPTTSSDAKAIAGNLDYLFEEVCPILADLDPCMKISSTKPPGCYFQEISGINLIVEDKQIPLPI